MVKQKAVGKLIRDISWLSFNARVLQEAQGKKTPLAERLRFLGIFSNNLDEFFRVRVATLNRMQKIGNYSKLDLAEKPQITLNRIQQIVLEQQKDFERIYREILTEMRKHDVHLVNEKELNRTQKEYVENYFNEKVRTNIAPLMIESIPELPVLHDKSIYLACVISNSQNSFMNSYALIEVPVPALPRFLILPSSGRQQKVILLEDVIRHCLPKLFTQFGFDTFEGYIIKVTRDAELDIDNDIKSNVIEQLEKGLKNRKKGKAVRLVYDKTIRKNLLNYLIKLLQLSHKDHFVPGGRIHNFKDFMDFPFEILGKRSSRNKPFIHPLLIQPVRILNVLDQRDVMLHFPYHSFDSIIDLLREAAIDPYVERIRVTCYRLAKESKVIHALINAARNGKKVTVVIELRARFDEEANLRWKRILEDEGVDVKVGLQHMKVHAKICQISKRSGSKLKLYGFVSTGNLHEITSNIYGDHCLLTSDKAIMADVSKVFNFLENQSKTELLKQCKTLILSPYQTRSFFIQKIRKEIIFHKKGKPAGFIIKLNSLTDDYLIDEIYNAASKGVDIRMIIRGICCAQTKHASWPSELKAISIVDEYLEHARVLQFTAGGNHELFISSADWMSRNLDYRIEVSVQIKDVLIKEELNHILQLQLSENEKARKLDNQQINQFVPRKSNEPLIRSQIEIYRYLRERKYTS